MRLREHEGIKKGSLDMLRADPRHLIVQENYNVRDLTTPDALEKLQELADSIAEVGVKDPLLVRFDGENIIVVEGHRRLAATMMAIESGCDIKSIPVYPEPQRINDAERDLGLIISNSGEPLTPLEKAKVVGRLVAHGWSGQDIAKKCGWKSVGSVTQYLDMLGMPEAVKEQVRAGDVSAHTARQIVKETAEDAKNDPEFAAKLIAANMEENKKIKGKGKNHRVTAKTLKRGKADKLPIPPRALRQGELESQTAKPEVKDEIQSQTPAVVATTPEPLPAESQERDDKTFLHDEHHEGIVRVVTQQHGVEARSEFERDIAGIEAHIKEKVGSTPAPSFPSRAIRDLLAALKPFADLCDDIDANEKADDDIVEVLFADIKNAWGAYTAATGGQEEEAA